MTSKKTQDQEVFEGLDFLSGFMGPDDSEMWPEKFRRLQWNNNEKAWEAPSKFWAGTVLESSSKIVEIDHGEKSEPGTLHKALNFAFIAQREMWEREGLDGRIEYASRYEPDFSSRIHFLALVKESEESMPVVITVGGYTAATMQAQYAQYRNAIRNATMTLQGRAAPGYLFWCEMQAGEKQMVGKEKQKSAIYPPTAVMPDLLGSLVEALEALFIGNHLANLIASALYSEGQQWAQEQPLLPAQASNGNDNSMVEVLPGGVLVFREDVTDWRKMIKCALDLGLFTEETDASRAFAKFSRKNLLARSEPGKQWERWQTHLQEMYIEHLERAEAIQREQELQADR